MKNFTKFQMLRSCFLEIRWIISLKISFIAMVRIFYPEESRRHTGNFIGINQPALCAAAFLSPGQSRRSCGCGGKLKSWLRPKKTTIEEPTVRFSTGIWNREFLIDAANFFSFFWHTAGRKIDLKLPATAYYRRTVRVKFDKHQKNMDLVQSLLCSPKGESAKSSSSFRH